MFTSTPERKKEKVSHHDDDDDPSYDRQSFGVIVRFRMDGPRPGTFVDIYIYVHISRLVANKQRKIPSSY